MQRGIQDDAGNQDRMAHIRSKFHRITFDLPRPAGLGRELILIGVCAFLEATAEGPSFLVSDACRVLRCCQSGSARKHE